jgi:hypothetical protein
MSFCEWLARTPGSLALHESLWVYPIVESVHVLTLCLFVGTAFLLDLRLMGLAMQRVPVSQVGGLLPWTRAGFAVMLISGALLFYAVPVKTYLSVFFRLKMAMLLLAGCNAGVFHWTIYRSVWQWDLNGVPPPRARFAGALSLALWTGVIVAGRMIAY